MEFKDRNNIIEQSLKAFEKEHPFLSKWISLKVKIKLKLINMKKIKGIRMLKGNVEKLFKPHLIWDWCDFGLMLRINKQNNIGNYHFAIDIQIGWLNLWVQCWKKQEDTGLKGTYQGRL